MEGKIVGVSICAAPHSGSDRAELVGLFIDPNCWRRGIGKLLVEAVASQLLAIGVRRMTVVANPIALPFYYAAGFKPAGSVQLANYPDAPKLVRVLAENGSLDEPNR